MQFTLTYSGELKANGNSTHKHAIRREFHSQLLMLWEQIPLSQCRYWFDGTNPKSEIDLNRNVKSFRFVPLISPSVHAICELSIFLLKPESPGSVITQAGDIDNRLKTLFDALRVPTDNEIPKDAKPALDEDPFFCLLEDDALISRIEVDTDRLLKRTEKSTDVHLDIRVLTRPTQIRIGNRVSGSLVLLS